jgi:hypothetical protein
VPAAAVIPAPIAYIKVVAVKKLVVGFLARSAWPASKECGAGVLEPSFWRAPLPFAGSGAGSRSFTLKKLECSKQALRCEYISME